MKPMAFVRVHAWLIDMLTIAAWIAALAVVVVSLYLTDVMPALSASATQALSFLILVAPVTVGLALLESGSRGATVGKHARRLLVVTVDGRLQVSFGRALIRNTLKVALPWELGHLVVYGLAGGSSSGSVPAWLVLATAAAYVIPAIYVITLFVGNGRTPYDRLSRTTVTRSLDHSDPPRRSTVDRLPLQLE